MKVQIGTCPLGAKCEEVREDFVTKEQYLLRCPWYVNVRGYNANLGTEIDEWRCAIAWMPILQVNTAFESRKGAAATESFRNAVLSPAPRMEQLT